MLPRVCSAITVAGDAELAECSSRRAPVEAFNDNPTKARVFTGGMGGGTGTPAAEAKEEGGWAEGGEGEEGATGGDCGRVEDGRCHGWSNEGGDEVREAYVAGGRPENRRRGGRPGLEASFCSWAVGDEGIRTTRENRRGP